MMEQSLKHKARQQKKEEENLLRMEFVGVNVNEISGGLNDMTPDEWSKEVESFCNQSIDKVLTTKLWSKYKLILVRFIIFVTFYIPCYILIVENESDVPRP